MNTPEQSQLDKASAYVDQYDASLLFPSNAWRNEYYVASYQVLTDGTVFWPSLMAVTAYQDGTEVTSSRSKATPPIQV